MLLPALLLALVAPSLQALVSPCPEVLEIEELNPKESYRWYGKLSLPPGGHWLFLSITLDKKANLLGNWHGDVTTQDNIKYKIDNPEIKTKRAPIRFFVQFDEEEPPPEIQLIKLDGREICFANDVKQGPSKVEAEPAPLKIETHTTRSVPSHNKPTTSEYLVPINAFNSDGPVQCGTVKVNNPVALVVDGAPTLEGQWPWQVALYRNENVNHNYICGGTLVSHRHIVTAAHCTTVQGSRPPMKVLENTLTVYLGKHDLITSVKGVQIRFVSKITNHPEYDILSSHSRDISILELQDPVQYTNWVQPACLWQDKLIDLNNIIGRKGSVVGWGNTGTGKLQLVEMPVVSQETCLRSHGNGFFLSVTSDFTYCAGQRNGQSACNGDSGGGMMFKIGGMWHIRGVVSVAPSKGDENVCDPTHYVVFTDIAKFLPWIRENIEPY